MKTQIMTFNISNTFEEWANNFDSHREIQAAAGMTPLFRGPHESDPQKVCVVLQIEDEEKVGAFMAENEAAIWTRVTCSKQQRAILICNLSV